MPTNDVRYLNYGTHLILLLSSIENGEPLDSPDGLCDFLVKLVAKVGMRVLDGPRAVTEHAEPDKYGHSAVLILYESHAAVHSYPARGSLFLDLFSCKPFDDQDVISACRDVFGGFEISEHLLLNRGVHWNSSADASIREWVGTRGDVMPGNLTDGTS
jgi:S-adenosylmethionine decarboxylase